MDVWVWLLLGVLIGVPIGGALVAVLTAGKAEDAYRVGHFHGSHRMLLDPLDDEH